MSKIGKLEFRDYAMKKPITVTPTGTFVSPKDFMKTPSLSAGSLFSLEEDLKTKLTLERTKLEPDFKLGIFGVGIVTKDEIIENIEQNTSLGKEFVRAEMHYLNELTATLATASSLKKPKTPKIEQEEQPLDWNWIPIDWWKKWWYFFRKCALFCENTTDSVTKMAANYRKKYVHAAFKKRGFCIKLLEGTNDTRANFVLKAKSRRVVYISGIGHGSPTTYTGHMGDPILSVCNYNSQEIKNKIIHFLSCQTAKQLGPDLISKGAKAYAGYYENFTFVYDQPNTPMDDTMLFWQSDSTFDVMMALGKTVEEAHYATIAMFNYCINQVPNTVTATWLTWDRDYFRTPVIDPIYGDKTAKINPWILLPFTPFFELEEAIPELAVAP